MRIMIIDDEERMGGILARRLTSDGHDARSWTAPEDALAELAAFAPEVVVTDLKMPGLSGMDVLEHVARTLPNTATVMMTAHGSVSSAVEAMKLGAYDYLTKPFELDELRLLLQRITENQSLRRENTILRETLAERARFDNVVAVSQEMQDALERVRRVAPSEAAVLIRGESGVGKEVIATAIHAASRRSTGPLIKVNCGALTETLLESELFGHVRGSFTGAHADRAGYFEAAEAGTLFLDEIGEVSPALQVKLLRVLQDGSFSRVGSSEDLRANVRVIAATNRDLEAAVEVGAFRQDLYYRLNVVPIVVPPLRARREDIPPLIDFFRAKARVGEEAARRRFSAAAIDALRRYDWPGNVRELQNAVEYALVMAASDEVGLDDLPDSVRAMSPSSMPSTRRSGTTPVPRGGWA
jgi:two-component system NtrC family response regulator